MPSWPDPERRSWSDSLWIGSGSALFSAFTRMPSTRVLWISARSRQHMPGDAWILHTAGKSRRAKSSRRYARCFIQLPGRSRRNGHLPGFNRKPLLPVPWLAWRNSRCQPVRPQKQPAKQPSQQPVNRPRANGANVLRHRLEAFVHLSRHRGPCLKALGSSSEMGTLPREDASPCLGSVDVTPWRTRLEFPDCHYIRVSSPSGGVSGFRSVNFNAFRTRRASGQPPLTPRRSGRSSVRNVTKRYRFQRLDRPLRREVDPPLLEPASQQPLHQQRQGGHEDMCLHSRLDLMIDWPHRQHVLELAEPSLNLAQVLVDRHHLEHTQTRLAGRDHIFA